ncbi:MAG: thioredoxin-disulfide reductase [Syntrophomonadaceae bacterium]
MDNIYDLIILGGGPAGLSAGIYGARAHMRTAIIEKGKPGGQAATTEELENYPGFGPGTTGPALTRAMTDHAKALGALLINDTIHSLDLKSIPKKIIGKKDEYLARAVIFALGAEPRTLRVAGEGKLRGKGVSYCATCDADFFQELEVVVVGSGDAAIEEAEYLTKFADKVTMVVIHEEGKVDANRASAERAFQNPKLHWKWNSMVKSINGEDLVESVTLKNIKTGQEEEYKTDGVFIFIGTTPKTDLVKDVLELNEQGYIITDEKMATNIEGVFAAGDARDKYLRQVVTAAADGAIAAVAAEKYITETEFWEEKVLKAASPVAVVLYNPADMTGMEKIGLIENWAGNNPDLTIVKIDATRNEMLKKRYDLDLKSLPLVVLFHKEEMVSQISEITEKNLKELIAK